MNSEEKQLNSCSSGASCRFQICGGAGNPSCKPDVTNDCDMAALLEAEESVFHDLQLIKATSQINDILKSIPADPNGRNLSFLHTKMGVFLAWVEHGAEAVEDAVTSDDDNKTVAAALKLKL
jgi:hypothetical protein